MTPSTQVGIQVLRREDDFVNGLDIGRDWLVNPKERKERRARKGILQVFSLRSPLLNPLPLSRCSLRLIPLQVCLHERKGLLSFRQ